MNGGEFPQNQQRPGANGCVVLLLTAVALAVAVAVVASILIWFLPLVQPGASLRSIQPAVGAKLPRLELVPLTAAGPPVTLADLAGKVVLIEFWGTWCPPCQQEIPHIAALGQKYRDRNDFRLLAVSCGASLDEDFDKLQVATETFLAAKGLDLPTYADPGDVTRMAVDEVGRFWCYPTTLVLDRQGVIRGVWTGYEPGTEKEIVKLVQALLDPDQR